MRRRPRATVSLVLIAGFGAAAAAVSLTASAQSQAAVSPQPVHQRATTSPAAAAELARLRAQLSHSAKDAQWIRTQIAQLERMVAAAKASATAGSGGASGFRPTPVTYPASTPNRQPMIVEPSRTSPAAPARTDEPTDSVRPSNPHTEPSEPAEPSESAPPGENPTPEPTGGHDD